jgi:hypothetical protein
VFEDYCWNESVFFLVKLARSGFIPKRKKSQEISVKQARTNVDPSSTWLAKSWSLRSGEYMFGSFIEGIASCNGYCEFVTA